MAGSSTATRAPRILWDVLEEHLDEGAYGLVCFNRALESPARTLEDLARYPEERLIAQVDALLLGGAPVRERLLEPALTVIEDDDDAEPERMALAAWALLEANAFAALEPLLADPRPEVCAALCRAAVHVRNAKFDEQLARWIEESPSTPALATLLALAAARQLPPPNLLAPLQSDDLPLLVAAAQAARHGESARLLGVMQYLLEHEHPEVRNAALLASLAWGSQTAWLTCQRCAFDPAQPLRLATLLTAALGTRADHEQLLPLLQQEATRGLAIFALGFSGNTGIYASLAPYLAAPDSLDAKLAAQSLGLIFGFAPAADDFSLPPPARAEQPRLPPPEEDPEAEETLPPLERDDLDGDLVPLPEADLPMPNAAAIERHCQERAKLLGNKTRLLSGQPFSAAQLRNTLAAAPLRVRHALALALGVRGAGALWVDSRAASARQRTQLARIGSINLQRFSGF